MGYIVSDTLDTLTLIFFYIFVILSILNPIFESESIFSLPLLKPITPDNPKKTFWTTQRGVS